MNRCVAFLFLTGLSLSTTLADDSVLARIDAGAAPRSLVELRAMETRVKEVAAKVRPAVVSFSGGSGVIVSEDGLVLTVAHVARRAGREVTLTLSDGRRVKARTLGNDSGLDAGMVRIIDKGEWPAVEMGDSEALRRGQWCLAVGYPVSFRGGRPPPVRLGRVLAVNDSLVTTDCTVMGGDSGGPLFDLHGRVIGISSRVNDSLRRNFHVPVGVYRVDWKRFLAGEDFNSRAPNVAFLGVAPEQSASEAKIGRVVEGSAAEKAGLRAGDIIVELAGTKLESYAELRPLLRARKPGDTVAIVVRRGADRVTLSATLGRRSN